jgi:HAD superfamily hydrolase (TIGR01490 family)
MRASFFDIDGTLVKGFMIHEFPKHLSEIGAANKNLFQRMEDMLTSYVNKKVTYREAALKAPKLYADCIKGLREEYLTDEAKKFVKAHMKKMSQPYTDGLVKLMRTYGMTIGISGSPIEIVRAVGKALNFDLAYGSVFEVKNGIYTGKVKLNLIIREEKENIIGKIIKSKGIDAKNSFGFGDTDQDLPILSSVGFPVALNPSKELLRIARKNRWTSLSSNDDVEKTIKDIIVRQSQTMKSRYKKDFFQGVI